MKKLNFKFLILLPFSWWLMACTETSVKFTFKPEQPKAGKEVQFTNRTKKCDLFDWNFGDETTSNIENPTKIYTAAGTYEVTLHVSGKRHGTKTQTITVYDSLPTITDDLNIVDSIGIPLFADITLTPSIFNATNAIYSYQWSVSADNFMPLDSMRDSVCSLYFNRFEDSVVVTVRIEESGTDIIHNIAKTYRLRDTILSALLLQTSDGNKKIRLFSQDKFEQLRPISSQRQVQLLDSYSEERQIYNGNDYDLTKVGEIVAEPVRGFVIFMGKIYYRTTSEVGVVNVDGSYKTVLMPTSADALCVNAEINRIYWAIRDRIMTMPLLQTDNNRFNVTPTLLLRTTVDINKMVIDSERER